MERSLWRFHLIRGTANGPGSFSFQRKLCKERKRGGILRINGSLRRVPEECQLRRRHTADVIAVRDA